MNPGLLAIAQRGGNDGCGCVGVLLQVDVKSIGDDTLRGAKGSNDNSCVDRVGGQEELHRNVFLRLYTRDWLASPA